MPSRLRSPLRSLFSRSRDLTPSKGSRHLGAPPKAILYRIVGNHQAGFLNPDAVLKDLEFILKNEPTLPGLERRWLLNRVVDPKCRQELVDLLSEFRQSWKEIPFDHGAYRACWTDIGAVPEELHPWNPQFLRQSTQDQLQVLDYVGRAKSLYLFNDNVAFNLALLDGWSDASWVLPWPFNCLITGEAWAIIRPLLDLPHLSYVAIASTFVADRPELLMASSEPPLPNGMPLLGFARRSSPLYEENRRQTTGSDTDLISRLGLLTPWCDRDDHPCPWEGFESTPLADRAQLVQAGWAYRLGPVPTATIQERREAIRTYSRRVDMQLVGDALHRQPLRCWTTLMRAPLLAGLSSIAANARSIPPISVTDKPDALPGTPERSYVNAVPHWQGLAGSESGLERTRLLGLVGPVGGDVAQHYDRARLQLMIDCVCSLALDGQLNDSLASREHAACMLRSWFIDPATAMIPDGAYARLSAVDPGRNVLDAATDFRDLYPLLDAITLLRRSGVFTLAECQQLDDWFDAFLTWLAADSATFLQQLSASPACTWYHLLMLAIAAYRGRRNVAAQVFDNLPGLLARQFRADGSPISSAVDATLRHEQMFNLQAWSNLVVLSSALGRDLLDFTDSQGIGLQRVFRHAQSHLPSTEEFGDAGGLSPVQWLQAMQAISHTDPALVQVPDLPPLAPATSGLPPFWNLCRPQAS